jgi:hypothetical protein
LGPTKIDVRVKEPRAGVALQDAAFEAPAHAGYRAVTAAEAQDLWVVRR